MFRFANRVRLDLSRQGNITLHAGIRNSLTPLVQDTSNDVIYLPVVEGEGFSLHVTNNTPALAAIPARLGDGEVWTNVYRECPIVDPTQMPSSGGMWEVRARGMLTIDSFCLPGGLKADFVVSPTSVPLGENDKFYGIETYYRPPVDPNVVLGGVPGATARSTRSISSDVTVTAAPTQVGDRLITDLDYRPEAMLIAQVRLVSRHRMAEVLAEQGINLDPSANDDWVLRGLDRRYPLLINDTIPAS